MKNTQLSHLEFKNQQKNFKSNIVLVLENLEHAENIGSAFRLADAFNIEKLIVVKDKDLAFDKIKKAARNTQKVVEYEVASSTEQALDFVKDKGYTIVALEITNKSSPLREYDFSLDKGIVIIVGSENYGIQDKTLQKVEKTFHIDMFGNNSSMNVTSALAIALYKISEDYYTKK